MNKIILSFLFLTAWVTAFCDLTLVQDGKAQAEIILGENPTQSAGLGALELQYHLKKITGAEIPILKRPINKNFVHIFIGDLPDGKKETFSNERIVRSFQGNRIILTGKDTSARKPVDYNDPATFPFALPEEEYGYNGPLFAIYDFLEDLCDVRFFYYNDKGTVFPRKKTLTVKEIDRAHTPKFNAFRIIHVAGKRDLKTAGSLRDVKLNNLRWRQVQFYGNTNHNGYSIYFKHWGVAKRKTLQSSFITRRKDFFAQGYDGQGPEGDPIIRSNYAGDKDCPAQLCYSNPGTIAYFANEVMTYANGGCVKGGWLNFHGRHDINKTLIPRFAGQPFFYPIEPGDSQKNKVCLCEQCIKRVAPGAENISDHKFRFIADIAAKVAEQDPNAGVSTLAYIRTLFYPEHVTLPKNVSVQMCLPIYSWWHPVAYSKQHSAYKKWVKNEAAKRPMTLWTYMFNAQYDADVHFGKYKAFPHFYPERTIDLFKEFSADGIRGWFTESVKNHMFMELYLAARICYDDTLTKEQLLDDYYTRCYGKAAPYVRQFYEEIEKAAMTPDNCPAEWLKNKDVLVGPKGVKHPYWSTGLWSQDISWKLGTKSRMEKCSALLALAEKNADSETAKFMCSKLREIWDNALEGYKQYYEFARLKHSRTMLAAPVENSKGKAEKIAWAQIPYSELFTDSRFKKVKRDVRFQLAQDQTYLYFRITENAAPAKHEDMLQGHGFEMVFSKDGDYPTYYLIAEPSGKFYGKKFTIESDVRKNEIYDFSASVKSVPGENSWTLFITIPVKKLPFENGRLHCNMIRIRPGKDYAVWNATGSYDCMYKLEEAGNIVMLPFTIRSKNFNYVNPKLTREQKDPASENGYSGSIDFGYSWGLQAHIPAIFKGKYNLELYLRADEFPADTFFRIFVYDKKKKKIIFQKKVPRNLVSGKKTFEKITLKGIEINPDCYITVSSFNKKVGIPGKIYLEKIVIGK